MSRPDVRGVVSRVKDKVSTVLSDLRNGFTARVEPKKKKYFLRRKYNGYTNRLNDFLSAYGSYFVLEFAPYVVAYGLVLNTPLTVLAGMAFTWKTVLSWGLVFYVVENEVVDMLNQMKPTVRVTAKVD